MKRIAYLMLAAVAVALTVASCGDKKAPGTYWTLEGSIDGAGGKMLYVEAPTAQGGWYVVDSTEVGGNGDFIIEPARPLAPEIYRITVDNKNIYLPVDSIETLTLNANLNDFAAYSVDGSYGARTVVDISHKISALGSDINVEALEPIKKEAKGIIVGQITKSDEERDDRSGMVAYYLIAICNANGQPLFDPRNAADLRVIGAVANDFKTKRPNDPRTKYLETLYVSSRNALHPMASEIAVPLSSIPEFTLPDQNNTQQSITDLTSKGNVTLINFTSYGLPNSDFINDVMKGLYGKYKDRGFEIVQVALADDPYSWSHGRDGLPWVTLYASSESAGSILLTYQVDGVPTWFIVDRNGDLKQRIDRIEDLRGALEKAM